MRKIIFAVVFSIIGFVTATAQTTQLTKEELNFRNGIENFLKEEGFNPTIDNYDNSLNFKREGTRYWITVEDSSPTYVEFHISGFTLDSSEDIKKLKESCNKANLETKCAKAYVTESSVSFSVEVFCQTLEGFKNIFYRSMNALATSKKKAKDYYNE